MAKLFSLLTASFAEVGQQFAEQPASDAARGLLAGCIAVMREPLLVSFVDRSRCYVELAREKGSSTASLAHVAAAAGLMYLLPALPAGPEAGWAASPPLLGVDLLRQSFMPRLSAATREVRMGGAPPHAPRLLVAAPARHSRSPAACGH